MKFIFILIMCCLLQRSTYAQKVPNAFQFKGSLADSLTNKPLAFVTITVIEKTKQQALKSMLTKLDGTFDLSIPKDKSYQVVFSMVGYKSKLININYSEIEANNLNTIKLNPFSKQLKEVTIVAVKPLMTQQIDRITYNVQADPENKVLNVLDMLRKAPFISIDAGDNILLKGNSKYKILINGRTSSLVANNPSDIFKTMPASNIQRIEIITVPPAKYDAEGLTGIINIVLKKQVGQGYNATINLQENTISGPTGGLSLTSKVGKFGVTLNGGYNDQIKRYGNNFNMLQTLTPNQTFLTQSGNTTNKGYYAYSAVEVSYEIDTLNLITANFNYNKGKHDFFNDQLSQLFNSSNVLTQGYQLNNNSSSKYYGVNFGLNYQLGFKRSKDQLLTVSYQYSTIPRDNLNTLNFSNRYAYDMPNYFQHNASGTKENTIQLDYQQPVKPVNIEAGVKAILRNNYSNFSTEQLDSVTNNYAANGLNSNNFNYEQNVYSLYNSYQLNLKNWGIKAGLRIERTTIDADFISTSTLLKQSYTNFIPSVSILRTLKNNVSLSFGFTNRIERPDIYELNPFVDQSNPKFIFTGNPNLRPVLNHTINFGFSKYGKGAYNITLSYAYANNTIQNITNLQDSISYTTYQNIGSNKILGTNININYPLFKKCNFSLNGEVSYVSLKGYYNSLLYKNTGIQGFGFAYIGYQLNDTWRVGLNGAWYSANILLQGKSNAYFFSSINTTKDVLKKKVSLFFYVNNITEKYRDYRSYTKDPAFYQTNISRNLYRTVGFGFYYHFGKLNSNIKKTRTGINNDDLKSHKKSNEG